MPSFTILDRWATVDVIDVPFQGRHISSQHARGLRMRAYTRGTEFIDLCERRKDGEEMVRGTLRIPMHTIPALIDALQYVIAGELGRKALLITTGVNHDQDHETD